MANFLLLPFGSSGDTHPFIGIGRELQKRGHSVTVFCNGYFQKAVERAGLDFVEGGTVEMYMAMLENPDIWHPKKGFKAIVGNEFMPRAIRAQYELIEARFKADPNLTVVAGSLAMGARIAQEKLGVRMVNLHLQPMMFFSVESPPVAPTGRVPRWMPRPVTKLLYWIVDKHMYGPVIGGIVEPFRSELGLAKATNYLGEWMHSSKLMLGLFPKWFAHAGDWPGLLRQTGFPLFDDGADQPLDAAVEAYLARGEPPVVYTFGTGMKVGEKLFAAAAESCAKSGRRGILLTPFREQLPATLSAMATHFNYIPLARLLPRSAAIVHHGGIGTMSQALRAGVPQIVTPLAHDQFDNADRIVKLGVGAMVPSATVSGNALAENLSRLLNNPDVLQRCKAIAENFEGDNSIAETCDRLETFSRTGETPAK